MTLLLKQHYLNLPPGSTVSTFGKGVCVELIRRGIAVEVTARKAVTAPPANKSMSPASVKNKGGGK